MVHQNRTQNKICTFLGDTVTVMSPDGTPIQINASALQAAGAQNIPGMIGICKAYQCFTKNCK